MGLFTKEPEKRIPVKCPVCKYDMIYLDGSITADEGYICKNRNCAYWGIMRISE
jgi:hypothetical protein